MQLTEISDKSLDYTINFIIPHIKDNVNKVAFITYLLYIIFTFY